MSTAQEDGPPLLKYLDDLVENLRALAGTAIKGQDTQAIHDARVATRRLKAGTDLLESILPKRSRKPFERVTRSLRRQLGPLRDLDVMLDHLKEMRSAKFAEARDWMTRRLGECREKSLAKAQRKSPPERVLARLGTWWGLRQQIADGQAAIDSLLAQSVHLQLDGFAERTVEILESDPHALRIAGKYLRYTLEMARAQGHKLPRNVTRMFKQMQDALGLWHDYVVLMQRLLSESDRCDLALHQPRLQCEILGLAQWTLQKAQSHLQKMNDLWKQNGPELCEQIRSAFPLTSPAPPPGIDHPQIAPADQYLPPPSTAPSA